MSLQTIVKNMVAANEPEVNIAKVIKHYNQINKSPLKLTGEVAIEENIETPECEEEGMVWSEAEQKCVPKEETNQLYDYEGNVKETPKTSSNYSNAKVVPWESTTMAQDAWEQHLDQADDFYNPPSVYKNRYPSEEGNTETIKETIKVRGKDRPASLNFPGGSPTWI